MRLPRPELRDITLYLSLVVVSSLAIIFLGEVPWYRAVPTALVSCLFKTPIVRLHYLIWDKIDRRVKNRATLL